MHSITLPIAAVLGGQEYIILLSICAVFSIPIIAIVGHFYTRHRREKLWHETARLALEKGQPIPAGPEPERQGGGGAPAGAAFAAPAQGAGGERWGRQRHERKRESDLRGGLVLLGLGTALYLANRSMALPGFVLIGIGAALVVSYLLTRNDDGHRGPPPA
ncbi:MAG TPA: DUF6249 domain-containing protein [Opitutaceae bacterium]|nr:DUF6249 domain-containing protein [Opitutaceae bacterium]